MNQPRPESRISELESQMSIQGARIRELSSDTAEELRAISQDLKKLFDHMHKGFDQAHAYIDDRLAELKATQDKRFDKIEAIQVEQGQKLDLILQLLQSLGRREG